MEIVFDREQAFQLFAIFAGNVEQTAAALNVRPEVILKAADELGWLEKLAPIIALRKSSRPGDLERALSRAINFVQAHRLRMFIERVINRLAAMGEEEFEDYIFQGSETKTGETVRKLTTRALADLSSACEKCHAMTYLALDDTAKSRDSRKENDGGEAGGELHAAIAKSMAALRDDKSPRAILLDAQLEQAEASIKAVTKPTNPYDK